MGKDDTTTTVPNDETTEGTVPQTETVNTSTETGETPEKSTDQPSIDADALQAQIKRLEAALKKANSEAKDYRLKHSELSAKAKKYEDEEAAREAEKLSAAEKQELVRQNLEKQVAALQSERDDAIRINQELKISNAVASHAHRLGFADPDDAMRFLDRAEIEYGDDGNPTNVQDLLSAIIKAKPYLKAASKPAPTSGGATNPPRSQSSTPQALSWDVIAKLTPEQYEARRDEIQRWMNDPKNFHRR
jgi:myosin heavy subunit